MQQTIFTLFYFLGSIVVHMHAPMQYSENLFQITMFFTFHSHTVFMHINVRRWNFMEFTFKVDVQCFSFNFIRKIKKWFAKKKKTTTDAVEQMTNTRKHIYWSNVHKLIFMEINVFSSIYYLIMANMGEISKCFFPRMHWLPSIKSFSHAKSRELSIAEVKKKNCSLNDETNKFEFHETQMIGKDIKWTHKQCLFI